MDLRRQLAVIRSWFLLLVGAVLLASGTAYAVSVSIPKQYQADATLIVGQSLNTTNPDYNSLLASQRLSQTYAQVAVTRPLLDRVRAKLDLDLTTDQLATVVRADAPTNSTLIHITATDGSPERAAAIANEVSNALMSESPAIEGHSSARQQSVDRNLASTDAMIQANQARVDALAAQGSRTIAEDAELQQLQSQLASLRATYASLLGYSSDTGSSQLTLVEPAVSPTEPSSPRVPLNTALAGLIGLLIALGVAFLFEYLDDTVKTTADVEDATGLATLGAITRMKGGRERKEMYRLATILYPQSPVAEAYRALRTNLEFADVDHAIRTLLVTSSIPGEGKTTTAANLAVAFAQAGKRTILVDADLRKPAIQRIFDIPNQFGLSDLLRSDAVSPEAVLVGTEQPHLRVLPTGKLPPNPAELLGTHRMRKILDRLLADADLVILDSPPVQAVTDPAVLGARVDATLLVVDAGRTRKGVVGHAREQLAKTGARVVGVTINRLHGSDASGYYHHYGSYGHAGSDAASQPARTLS